jgi:branched-chain amino acid transport system ATP-binding protein
LNGTPYLAASQLSAFYGSLAALRDVSTSFQQGSRTGIFGHNGSGKSTFLKCLVGGVKSVSGSVRFRDNQIEPNVVYRNVRLGIAVVPQSRNVFPNLSVKQCLHIAGLRSSGHDYDAVFKILPVLADRQRQIAGSMSGGEQQMLAVGMALMTRPEVILLDEPTAGLSPVAARDVLAVLKSINQRLGTTIIMVEQNVLAALDMVERALVLRSGEIVYDGKSEALENKEDLWKLF